MSIHKESIQVIAQSLGMNKLKEDVCQAIANDVEYRLREILQEANKFMKHSKRKVLTSQDINYSLEIKNVEPLYGYKTRMNQKSHLFRKIPKKSLFFLQDNEMNIKESLQIPLPKVPLGPTISSHWLVIEGITPKIPQNPIVKMEEKEEKKEQIEVKPLIKHVLSQELQMYYEKVTEGIKNENKQNKENILESLTLDAGIQPLIPYFSQFISEQVTLNLRKLELLYYLMRMCHSLLMNPSLQLELYLHQFIPSILTCLVGKRLSNDPKENHWALRNLSSEIISFICKKYNSSYHTLEKRITKTLLHCLLDPNKPRTSHYGSIIGITSLGPHLTQLLLLNPIENSNLKIFYQFLEPELYSNNYIKRTEAFMCYNALLNASKSCYNYSELYEIFGESIITNNIYSLNILNPLL